MILEMAALKKFLQQEKPLLDVRAPVEFLAGHIPGAINLPILNDDERAQVGTLYKQKGQDAAIQLGQKLVSGVVKDQRVSAWKEFFLKYPDSMVYCFRGGLRSRTAQTWLQEVGVQIPRLEGGYKAARQMFLETIRDASETKSLILISGPTGGGKSHLLRAASAFLPVLDLEMLAQHRGSAFGFETQPQPQQAQFENFMAQDVLQMPVQTKATENKPILLEDESRLIGKNVIPENLFNKMRSSPILWVDEPLEQRVENIFDDYISQTAIGHASESDGLALFERYEKSLQSIQRRLGGLRTQELMTDLKNSKTHYLEKKELTSNRVWIEKLLVYYYDPLYLGSLEKRNPKVLFRGPSAKALEFLKDIKSFKQSMSKAFP